MLFNFDNVMKMTGRSVILIMIYLGSAFAATAQEVYFYAADSADRVISGISDTKEKIASLISLAKSAIHTDKQKALHYAQQALRVAENDKNQSGIAATYKVFGDYYSEISNYPLALQYYQMATTAYEKAGNQNEVIRSYINTGIIFRKQNLHQKSLEQYKLALLANRALANKRNEATIYANIAVTYFILGNYPQALTYSLQALKTSEQTGDLELLADNTGNIGGIYHKQGNYDKALEYYLKAIAYNKQLNNKSRVALWTGNVGVIYLVKNDYSRALQYFNEALVTFREMGNRHSIAVNTENIGTLQVKQQLWNQAEKQFHAALTMYRAIDEQDGIARCLRNLGNIYISRSQDSAIRLPAKEQAALLKQGINNLTQAADIFTSIGDLDYLNSTYLMLSRAQELNGDPAAALANFKLYTLYKDSLFSEDKTKALTRLEVQYEFSKLEDSLQMQNQLTAARLQQSLLLTQQQEQTLQLYSREQELQRMAFLKSQTELENARLARQEKERTIRLLEKEKQLQSVSLSAATLKLRQQWISGISLLLLLTGLTAFLFYRNQVQRNKLITALEQERLKQEQKETEFQNKVSNLALSSLRSQMNPHFIFNCLNSIKLYAAENNSEAASTYLSKFSRLIRQVLEHSKEERITMREELDTMNLYLEMESMRFKEKLNYQVQVDHDIDPDYFEIPPMLVQPYVENAIWHGLMHRKQGGRVHIHYGYNDTDEVMTIIIRDDGVGRAMSALLKPATIESHQSFGTRISQERVGIMQQMYAAEASVTINDLYDVEGLPAGTEVIIKIPV